LFTRSAFISFKRQQAAAQHASQTPKSTDPSTDPPNSPILDFSDEVIQDDAIRMPYRAMPGSTATLKPHMFWISPFATKLSETTSNSTVVENKAFRERLLP
jgi:hypothetical protein